MRNSLFVGLVVVMGCRAPQSKSAAQNPIPVRVALDTISVERAEELDGKLVTASLLVAKPFYVLAGKTVVGGPDQVDGIERGIVMSGDRYDAAEGKRIAVTGQLWVIDHAPALVGTVFVPGWREIRVVEMK